MGRAREGVEVKRILRVTYFKWGDSINNWYPDIESVKRQLEGEKDRVRSSDITREEWFEATQIEKPKV